MSEFAHRGRGHDFSYAPASAGRDNDVPSLSREEAFEATAKRVSADAEALRGMVDQAIARCTSKADWAVERTRLNERATTLASQLRFHAQRAPESNGPANSLLEQAKATLHRVSESLATERTLRARPPVAGELDLEPAVLSRSAPALTLFNWAAGLSRRERDALKERFAKHSAEDHFANELHNFLSNSRTFLLFQEVLDDPSKLKKHAPRLQRMQQDNAPAGPSGSNAAQVAEDGVADANEALPHLQTLQSLFGRHDLSSIKAQVGGSAAESASTLGAKAFATGDRVGFASAPDLHTAAHEAAHVVQQQAGVALKAELDGGSSDPHEQHADAVADAVVRGEHVEKILDRAPDSGRGSVVSRKRDGESTTTAPTALAQFLAVNEVDIRDAVAARLRDYGWPDPAEDVHYTASGERIFSTQLYRLVRPKLTSTTLLQQLVAPGDLVEEFHSLVDKARGQDARAFGKSISQLLQWAARDSLVERIGPQYRRLWAKNFEPPQADDLATKHPMDSLVASALTTAGVVDLREMPAAEIEPSSSVAPKRGKHAPETKHGTAAPKTPETTPSTQELLAVEHDIGTRLDAIRELVAPLGYGELLRRATYARLERVAVLKNGDEATRARYVPVLQFQHTQLIAIATALPPIVAQFWPLRGVPDFALTAGKRHERDELQRLVATYARAAGSSDHREQSTEILREIEVRQRHQQRAQFDAVQRDAELATEDVVESTPYNAPTGTANAMDLVAHQRQSMLDGTRKGHSPYEQQRALVAGGEIALTARLQSAEHALVQLQQAAAAVYGDTEGFARAYPQFRPLPLIIQDVTDHLNDVRRTWDKEIRDRESTVADPNDPTKQNPAVQDDPNAPDDWVNIKARAAALPVAQQAFAKIAGKQDLATFVNKAAKEIQDQRIVDAVVQLGVALLLTVATGVGAAALGAAAAEAIAVEGSSFGMRALAVGADLAVNVTINTAVQLAISQPTRRRSVDASGNESEESDFAVAGSMLLENLLMDAFTRGLAAPLKKAQQAALEEGRLIATLPHLSKAEADALGSFKFAGADLAVDFVGGMSAQWAAHRLTETFRKNGEEVSEPFALTVLQQGAAIGLGKFFHGQLAAWQNHRKALEKTSFGHSAEAQRLIADRDAFYKRAKQLADSLSPDPTALHELLSTNDALLVRERLLVSSETAHASAPPHEHSPANETHARREPSQGTATAGHKAEAITGASNVNPQPSPHEGQLDGDAIASRVPGVIYEPGGTFRINARGSVVDATVRRTNGYARVVNDGHGIVLEIPRGFNRTQVERALVEQLQQVRIQLEHGASKRADAHNVTTDADAEITATIVPGSEFHGRGRSTAEPDAVVQDAREALGTVQAHLSADVERITEQAGDTYEVVLSLRSGQATATRFTMRVSATQLSYGKVAHSYVNTSKRAHVIQLSDRVARSEIPRALIHEVAEIVAKVRAAETGTVLPDVDVLQPGAHDRGNQLSPHDYGRLAEVKYLVRELEHARSTTTATADVQRLRSELTAVVEHLGLRQGTPGAEERLALVREQLDVDTARVIGELSRPEQQLSRHDQDALKHVNEVARERDQPKLDAEQAHNLPLHELPRAKASDIDPITGRVSREKAAEMAHRAEVRRTEKSAATVAKLLTKIAEAHARGEQYAVIEQHVQLGGGASVAAVTPDTLYIDDRGRWQKDPSKDIAQTAGQMASTKASGIGEPHQFAGPDERVPLDAIRFWEDSIAAQADVVDGRGTIRFDEQGRTLLDIMPTAGGGPLTFQLNTTPTIATGFPRERLPGQQLAPHRAVDTVKARLRALGTPEATAALGQLEHNNGTSEQDAAAVSGALTESLRTALLAGEAPDSQIAQAIATLNAAGVWASARATAPGRVLRGDEANLKSFDPDATDTWLIAGTGGTGISAAEIILENNPRARVTMLGREISPALATNTQWVQIQARYGTGVSERNRRFFVEAGHSIGELQVSGGEYTIDSHTAHGYIAALGRDGLVPQPIADLVASNYSRDPSSVRGELMVHKESGKYLGYRLIVTETNGTVQKFEITGATSRFLPPEIFSSDQRNFVRNMQDRDAPDESGGFDGGFDASANQSAEYARSRRDGSIVAPNLGGGR